MKMLSEHRIMQFQLEFYGILMVDSASKIIVMSSFRLIDKNGPSHSIIIIHFDIKLAWEVE
jgi:hypothetical protein